MPSALGMITGRPHYTPIAQRIDDLRRWVFGVIGVGFVVLYGGLGALVWRGWRTMNRPAGGPGPHAYGPPGGHWGTPPGAGADRGHVARLGGAHQEAASPGRLQPGRDGHFASMMRFATGLLILLVILRRFPQKNVPHGHCLPPAGGGPLGFRRVPPTQAYPLMSHERIPVFVLMWIRQFCECFARVSVFC